MARRIVLRSLAAGLLALLVACGGAAGPRERVGEGALRVDEILGGDPAGFAVADRPRPLVFPEDHGPHPDFRSEWWYLTGSLTGSDGRPLGFQITFFRTALAPDAALRESRWGTRQLYMAHLAVSDPRGGGFRAYERFGRGGSLELAGARARPFRVWLEGWEMASLDETQESTFPVHVRAASADRADAVDLVLQPDKPVVLQGADGLSHKGASAANASYYYSYTRLRASGSLRAGGEEHAVNGTAWLDREWSTSALESEQVGWDWFALQLDNGRDLMLYRLRRRDGAVDPHSSGVVVDGEGGVDRLAAQDFTITVLEHWNSRRSGIRYPARWRLEVPSDGLTLEVTPLLADQELNLAFRYWEGAVDVTGQRAGAAVAGRGYVELTGYSRESALDVPLESPRTLSPDQNSERSSR